MGFAVNSTIDLRGELRSATWKKDFIVVFKLQCRNAMLTRSLTVKPVLAMREQPFFHFTLSIYDLPWSNEEAEVVDDPKNKHAAKSHIIAYLSCGLYSQSTSSQSSQLLLIVLYWFYFRPLFPVESVRTRVLVTWYHLLCLLRSNPNGIIECSSTLPDGTISEYNSLDASSKTIKQPWQSSQNNHLKHRIQFLLFVNDVDMRWKEKTFHKKKQKKKKSLPLSKTIQITPLLRRPPRLTILTILTMKMVLLQSHYQIHPRHQCHHLTMMYLCLGATALKNRPCHRQRARLQRRPRSLPILPLLCQPRLPLAVIRLFLLWIRSLWNSSLMHDTITPKKR